MLPTPAVSASAPAAPSDRFWASLLGLHGLALLVVFPLGPQETRLWHPGVGGVAALAAAYPLAACLGGLLARRAPILPARPVALVSLALLGTLPCALSVDHPTLLLARLWAGLLAGLSYVAIQRALPASAATRAPRLAPRVVAFGMPLCLLGAALADWRFAFAPLLAGQIALFFVAGRNTAGDARRASARFPLREPAPLALLATGSLAGVSAAYLTVLSGFLVFNAGHTEFHIPAALLLGALLGLAAPPLFAAATRRLSAGRAYALALTVASGSLASLLLLQEPLSAAAAVGLIACFLAANAIRHLALAGLINPRLPCEAVSAHQLHTHLAHHLGSGLGALSAALLVSRSPDHTLSGMPALLALGLGLGAVALGAGLAAGRRLSAARSPKVATSRPDAAEKLAGLSA